MKNLCKSNNYIECMKCTQGPCDSRITTGPYVMPTTSTKIPMPPVKEPKTSVGSLTVDVGVNGMEEAIKQLQALKRLYTDIDTLQQRIIKGHEKIRVANAYNVNIEVLDKPINADYFFKQFEEAVRSQYRKGSSKI